MQKLHVPCLSSPECLVMINFVNELMIMIVPYGGGGRFWCPWNDNCMSNHDYNSHFTTWHCCVTVTLYRPMTHFSVMKLLFPYDQWRVLASWLHTCVCKSFPEDSGELWTAFSHNGIHYTYQKLNCAYLWRDNVGMSRKLNVVNCVMLSQTKRRSLSRQISRTKHATEMKQKVTNS